MNETKHPLSPHRGPYKVAIYDKDGELVMVANQDKWNNIRPKVEELVVAVQESREWARGNTLYPESSFWEKVKQKAREVETALKGK